MCSIYNDNEKKNENKYKKNIQQTCKLGPQRVQPMYSQTIHISL